MVKRPRPQISDFRVAWICAIQVEVDAARRVLDDEYEDFPNAANYILGRVGWHNVVIACPPAGQIGIGAAAVTAERLRASFPAVQYWLMVGIGGGVPSSTADVRLGDVVVSQPQGSFGGVVQYDMVKTGPNGQRRTGSLNAPPQELLAAVTKMRSNIEIGKSGLYNCLAALSSSEHFCRPESCSDMLFEASYIHSEGSDCRNCLSQRVVPRSKRLSADPLIHYGLIASGNQVIKDGNTRDSLSQELGGILCFEMEAAGLMNSVSCLVVRGICDYADSHKHKQWQPFAAAAAACCAKEVLSCVSLREQSLDLRNHRDQSGTRFVPLVDTMAITKAAQHDHLLMNNASQSEQVPQITLTNAALSAEKQQQYFELLRFDQIESRHLSVKTAHAKTCRWLLQKPELQDWLNVNKLKDHGGFLWIKGKAATGKSTIMKFLLAHVKKAKIATNTLAFFFNARGEAIEKSTLGMYRSLLYQLLEQCPDLKSIFDLQIVTLDADESIKWTIEVLRVLLSVAIGRLGSRSLVCLIDALDECADSEVQDMIRFFGEVGLSAMDSGSEVRILLSSRHYPHIDVENGISLVLEDQREHSDDIVEYLRTELKAGMSQKAQKIREDILQRASGIFLWVVLVVDILNGEYRRGRIQALEKRLREVPNDIEKLFDDILFRGGSCSDETVLCLQWVLYAKRPLKLAELYFAIRAFFDAQEVKEWDEAEIARDDMERYILDVSRGLLEQTKAKVRTFQFIHESVREFFLSKKALDRPPFAPADDFLARSNSRLQSACLSYVVGTAQSDVTGEWTSNSSKFPFLEYAVQNILSHLNNAGEHPETFELALNSLRSSYWLQILKFLQKSNRRSSEYANCLLYVLADQDLLPLMRHKLRSPIVMAQLVEKHQWLILAGLATYDESNRHLIQSRLRAGMKARDIVPGLNLSDEVVQEAMNLLQKERHSISEKILDTPLIWASRKGHDVLVELLLADSGTDLYARDHRGNDAVKLAVLSSRRGILRKLLAQDATLREQKPEADEHYFSWLCQAVEEGKSEIVEIILSFEGSASANLVRDKSILFATKNRKKQAVEHLLEKFQPLPGCHSQWWVVPVITAVSNGDIAIIEVFLRYMVAYIKKSAGPPSFIIEPDDLEQLKELSGRSDMIPSSHEEIMQSLLVLAIQIRNLEIVESLLNCNSVDVNGQGHSYAYGRLPSCKKSFPDLRTPLYMAVKTGNTAMVELLLQYPSIDVNWSKGYNFSTPLYKAVCEEFGSIVRLLLGHHAIEINTSHERGITPLLRAIHRRNTEVVLLLLGHKDILVNKADTDGCSPLMHICESGLWRLSILEALLRREGFDVNAIDSKGQTALHKSALNNTLTYVLRYGHLNIDPDAEDFPEKIALYMATKSYFVERVRLLLGHPDINVASEDCEGNTALHLAVQSQLTETVKLFLARSDVNVNAKTSMGKTALHLAANTSDPGMVELLLGLPDFDFNAKDSMGRTALHLAADRTDPRIAELLLGHPDVDVNAKDSTGKTALHIAVCFCYIPAIELLLGHPNIDVNAKDSTGKTALHAVVGLAPRVWRRKTLLLILNHSQTAVDATDNGGNTPYDLAVDSQSSWAIKILQKHGGVNSSVTSPE